MEFSPRTAGRPTPQARPTRRSALLGGTALGAAALATLSACSEAPAEGGSAGADGSTGSSADGGLEWDDATGGYVMEEAVASGEAPLTLWVEYEEYGDAIVAAFQEIHPDVRIDVEIVAKVDAGERMALDGEAGTGADVFTLAYDQLGRTIDAGVAAPIGQYQDALTERTGEVFVSAVSRDGEMRAVPISTESIALFYNRTLLEELTGSAEPATTWEEIAELAATYNDSATNTWTIRFLSGELYYAYPVLSSLGWQLFPEGDVEQPHLDSPELTSGLEYYATLRDVWDVNSADATYDSIENEFVKGETPYVITGPWTFGDFDAAAESLGFEYGVTALPSVADGDPASSLAGLSVAVVSGYTEYPAAARVLADFLASDAGAAALYSSIGAIPALTPELSAGVEGLADDEHAQGILAQSQNADLVEEIPEHLYTVGNALVANVWDGVLGVADAQEQAESDYASLSGLGE